MGAKYDFIIVGSRKEYDPPHWQPILRMAGKLLDRTMGELQKVMLLNVKANLQTQFNMTDSLILQYTLLQPDEMLFFYPKTGDRCAEFSANERFWSFTICLPVSDQDLNDFTAQEILIDLWTSLYPMNPKFGVAGEELSVSQEETQRILNGQISPIELALCDIAIISNEIPQKANPLMKMVEGGTLQRKRFFFKVTRKDRANCSDLQS